VRTRADLPVPIRQDEFLNSLTGTDFAGAGTKKVSFEIYKSRGRALVRGISVGIDDTDVIAQRVTGWVVIMPDRRTIQLRDQGIGDPVILYNSQDGTRNGLQITNVTGSSATGYLLVSSN
jgi:hypothetical protein